jgi:hypothetical protein
VNGRARKDKNAPQVAIHPALDPYVRDAEVQHLLPLGRYADLSCGSRIAQRHEAGLWLSSSR